MKDDTFAEEYNEELKWKKIGLKLVNAVFIFI